MAENKYAARRFHFALATRLELQLQVPLDNARCTQAKHAHACSLRGLPAAGGSFEAVRLTVQDAAAQGLLRQDLAVTKRQFLMPDPLRKRARPLPCNLDESGIP